MAKMSLVGGSALLSALVLTLLVLMPVPRGIAQTDERCIQVDRGFGPAGQVRIRVEPVVTGLEVPWGLAFLPDGGMLITERPDRIRRVVDGRLDTDPVARVATDAGGEGGLLGLALHPRFEANRLFFVYFTPREGGRAVNRVERWRLAADGRQAEREKLILDQPSSAPDRADP